MCTKQKRKAGEVGVWGGGGGRRVGGGGGRGAETSFVDLAILSYFGSLLLHEN